MCGFPKVNRRGMFSYDAGPVTGRGQLKRRGGAEGWCPQTGEIARYIINNARRASLFTMSRAFARAGFYDTSTWPVLFVLASTYLSISFYLSVMLFHFFLAIMLCVCDFLALEGTGALCPNKAPINNSFSIPYIQSNTFPTLNIPFVYNFSILYLIFCLFS